MKFDGLHTPNEIQLEIDAWVKKNRPHYDVLGIQAPTGVGKTASLVSLVDLIIAPNNHLIDQCTATYPDINVLKGAEHYSCKKAGDCQTKIMLFGKACDKCPYKQAKADVKNRKQSVANPLSYYYMTLDSKFKHPVNIGVDEADKLESMLNMAASLNISHKGVQVPRVDKAAELLPWLEEQKALAVEKKVLGKAGKYARMIQLIGLYGEQFKVVREEEETLLFPLLPMTGFLETVTKSNNLLLMSATLFERDVKRIAGNRSYKFLELESPIPVANRRILFRPICASGKPNSLQVVKWIRELQQEIPTKGSICHLTYGMQGQVKTKFPRALINTPKDKAEIVDKLSNRGGLWLASGCHEGVDLKGDIARLNMIPVVPFDYLGDPAVKAKKDLAGGADEYALSALKKVIQMAGRTTRGVDDKSVTVIGDPRFLWLVNKYKAQLPKSFIESIDWRGKV